MASYECLARRPRHCKLVLAFLSASVSSADHLHGAVYLPPEGEVFISKYVFDTHPSEVVGMVDVTLWSDDPERLSAVRFATFDDEEGSYPGRPEEEWTRKPCEERLALAKGSHRLRSGQTLSINISEKVRRRWWYMALMDCNGLGISLSYDIHVWNPMQGLQAEFSMDQQDVLPLFGLLLCVYSALAAFQLWNNSAGRSAWGPEWSAHPMVVMLTASVLLFAASTVLYSVYYGRFAAIGEGFFAIYLAAKLLQSLAKFSLMSIMLLLARGRCVSYALTADDVRLTAKVLLPFLAFCVGLELWGENAASQMYTTDYIYHTPLGCLLVLVDLFLLVVFLVSLRATYRIEADPEKQRFYRILGVACAMWFVTLPGAALLAVFLSSWVRVKILLALTHTAHACACAVIVYILQPSRTTYMDATACINNNSVELIVPYLLGQKIGGVKLALGPLQAQPDSLEHSEG